MKQYAKELHAPVKRKFKRESVTTYAKDEVWGADLVDMASRKDGEFRYIFTVIDLFSRYAWAIPLKNKKADSIVEAFKQIKGKRPQYLWVDQGSEFYNKKVKEYLKNTKIYSTYSGLKSVYAERFNRTLKNKMFEVFTELQNEEWTKFLDMLVKDYNDDVHSSTGKTPESVYLGKEKPIIKIRAEKIKKPKYKVGDFVRIAKTRGIFGKGYEAGWTEEVFKIIKVNQTDPTTYDIEDQKGDEVTGKFYEEELQKTDLKDFALVEKEIEKRGNKVKVKFKGYSDKFNEWISTAQLKKLKNTRQQK